MTQFTLSSLESIILERAKASPEDSWTAKLLAGGTSKIAKKFGEEAIEAVIAAVENNKPELIKESADVIFHLLVLLKDQNISVLDVMSELERRTNQSGLVEKAGR
jgi:phosphoribosyl-ATP pyrophosphohydrolase